MSNVLTEAVIIERFVSKNKLHLNFWTNLVRKNTLLDIYAKCRVPRIKFCL